MSKPIIGITMLYLFIFVITWMTTEFKYAFVATIMLLWVFVSTLLIMGVL